MRNVLIFLTSYVLLLFSRTIVLAENFLPNIFQSIVLPELRGEYTPYTILIKQILAIGGILLVVLLAIALIIFLVKIFSKGKKSKN